MKSLAVAAVLTLGAGPALATEWMYCGDRDSTVTVGLLLGAMDVLAVAGVILSHEDKVWASDVAYGPGEPVSVGQGFEDDTRLFVDLMDDGMVNVLAELRLMKAEEGDGPVIHAGTLRLPGRGAWAVSCDAP